ncbi:MAG: GNAT family N-acetyltransferase [Saprospiraceae bacterium]
MLVHLTLADLPAMLPLLHQLNPDRPESTIVDRITIMFGLPHYRCFGWRDPEQDGRLIALSGGWRSTRIYCGEQLEIDHVIVDGSVQSGGVGARFLAAIENWARENGVESVELNAYTINYRGHKFYFRNEYHILGYHFQKVL